LRRRLTVDARLDLEVKALAATAEQDGGEQHEKKTQIGCSHGDTLCLGDWRRFWRTRMRAHIAGAWILTSPGLMILSSSVVAPLIDLRLASSILRSLNSTFLPNEPTSIVSVWVS